jgi:hypothetical protein
MLKRFFISLLALSLLFFIIIPLAQADEINTKIIVEDNGGEATNPGGTGGNTNTTNGTNPCGINIDDTSLTRDGDVIQDTTTGRIFIVRRDPENKGALLFFEATLEDQLGLFIGAMFQNEKGELKDLGKFKVMGYIQEEKFRSCLDQRIMEIYQGANFGQGLSKERQQELWDILMGKSEVKNASDPCYQLASAKKELIKLDNLNSQLSDMINYWKTQLKSLNKKLEGESLTSSKTKEREEEMVSAAETFFQAKRYQEETLARISKQKSWIAKLLSRCPSTSSSSPACVKAENGLSLWITGFSDFKIPEVTDIMSMQDVLVDLEKCPKVFLSLPCETIKSVREFLEKEREESSDKKIIDPLVKMVEERASECTSSLPSEPISSTSGGKTCQTVEATLELVSSSAAPQTGAVEISAKALGEPSLLNQATFWFSNTVQSLLNFIWDFIFGIKK